MKPLTEKDISSAFSKEYADYLRHFVQQRADFSRTMASFGLSVSTDATAPVRIEGLRRRLAQAGARFRNGEKSIVWGELSPACIRCRTGIKSVSEFLSLACHRSCWFCFNENQCDYQLYRNQQKD